MKESAKEKLSVAMSSKCLPQCWRARAPECVCICGGANHGKAIDSEGTMHYDWYPGKEKVDGEGASRGDEDTR